MSKPPKTVSFLPKMTLTDEDYLRWLEDPQVTLGTPLRREIAKRYRQLLREPKNGKEAVPAHRQDRLPQSQSGAEGGSLHAEKTEAEQEQRA